MVPRLADLVWPGLGSRKLKIDDENDTASMEGRRQVNQYFRHYAYVQQKGARQKDIDAQAGAGYYRYPSFAEALGATLSASVYYHDALATGVTSVHALVFAAVVFRKGVPMIAESAIP